MFRMSRKGVCEERIAHASLLTIRRLLTSSSSEIAIMLTRYGNRTVAPYTDHVPVRTSSHTMVLPLVAGQS